MGQLVGCIRGIGEACRALDFPIVSGNVSLYNESAGRGILPTPSIGGVGIIADVAASMGIGFVAEGEAILLIGETLGWLGQSLYLREICGREEGAPPPVDLAAEKRNGDFVRGLIEERRVTAVHDLADGGLAVALAEMALAGGIGATVDMPGDRPPHGWLFGEDQARYLVTASTSDADFILRYADPDVAIERIGTTGGDALQLGEAAASLAALRDAHEGWLPRYMGSHQ